MLSDSSKWKRETKSPEIFSKARSSSWSLTEIPIRATIPFFLPGLRRHQQCLLEALTVVVQSYTHTISSPYSFILRGFRSTDQDSAKLLTRCGQRSHQSIAGRWDLDKQQGSDFSVTGEPFLSFLCFLTSQTRSHGAPAFTSRVPGAGRTEGPGR